MSAARVTSDNQTLGPGLDVFQILNFYTLFPLHRIFRHMHGVLNIDKKLTNCQIQTKMIQ
jgi:hypothetical protein